MCFQWNVPRLTFITQWKIGITLCQEDGYVCSKKPLVSERAIVAYRKATEGTTIYENAEDYGLVIRMNSYGAAFYLMILFPVEQRMMNTLITSSLQQ